MAAVELARRAQDLPEGARRRRSVSMSTGRQRVTKTKRTISSTSPITVDRRGERRFGVEVDDFRGGGDGAAERLRHLRPGDRAAGQARAGGPLRRHPGERFAPLVLRLRPGRAVVEALFAFAPAAVVGGPGERPGRGHAARHQDRRQLQFAQRFGGVVAAEAGAVLAVLDVHRGVVEGRVRARRRVDDRVRPFLLHLAVFPGGALAAGVLEEDDFGRFFVQRRRRRSASKVICMPSQSPSCRSLNWLKYQKNQYWRANPEWPFSRAMWA